MFSKSRGLHLVLPCSNLWLDSYLTKRPACMPWRCH